MIEVRCNPYLDFDKYSKKLTDVYSLEYQIQRYISSVCEGHIGCIIKENNDVDLLFTDSDAPTAIFNNRKLTEFGENILHNFSYTKKT